MIQTQGNSKKDHFGPDLGPLNPNSHCRNSVSKIWLRESLDIMVRYQNVKYHKKLMVQF